MWEKVFALSRRRGFIWPAFDIYGGLRGFYDYGPLGAAMKDNIISIWKRYYVLEEGMAEIDSPNLGPEDVFRASGHLEKFEDLMTTCTKCGTSFRADRLITAENADALGPDELWSEMQREGIKCPECGGELTKPEPFNLMFRTSIGPKGKRERTGYLRPETAQAMFMDFQYLYRYFRENLPFGAVQVGKGFRNEISPRQGLLRLREFNMAEAEIFFDPESKRWPNFNRYRDDEVLLLPNTGEETRISLGDAVENGIIENEALAYFVGLTRRFLIDVGIDEKRLRFREHLQDEMAHYADDCWDAEVLLSYGWTEIVGIADRTDYDLSRHGRFSGANLKAMRKYEEPRTVRVREIVPDFKKLGPVFKKDAKRVGEMLRALDADVSGSIEIELDGRRVTVPEDAYSLREVEKKIGGEDFIPHVIEPSYGIDRILYSVLEHNYIEIEEGGEIYRRLSLPPYVAPVTAGVFPLMARDGLDKLAEEIWTDLRKSGINAVYDDSGSIGRRYARMDEIGTPFCITVDYQTLEDDTVTVRNRENKRQERISVGDISKKITDMVGGGIL